MHFKVGMRVGAAVLCVAAVAVAGNAGAQTVRLGNLIATINGGVSPKKLPRRKPAPITLNVSGALKTADGTHVPALQTLEIEFDKHGHLYTKGLASCTVGRLQSTLTAQAKRACGKALVGSGHVTAEVALPEQAPFSAGGPLLIFNGSRGNKQMLIFHVYAHVPAPTTVVTTAKISKVHGKYGTKAFIRIPSITSGQGSLTSFKAKMRKSWTYRHKKQNLLLASCPTGRLFAHGEFNFAGNVKLSGKVVRSCTPKG
jgi:hypothetical protein